MLSAFQAYIPVTTKKIANHPSLQCFLFIEKCPFEKYSQRQKDALNAQFRSLEETSSLTPFKK